MTDEIVPVPINPPPGVVKTETPRSSAGRWIDTQLVRFVDGKAEKVGGWTKQTDTAMAGSPRTLHAWRDNNSIEYIGAGTYKKLYVVDRSFTLNDITPIEESGNLTNPFTTTNGSAVVTVIDNGHARRVGNTVIFSGATASGGITINGAYTVDEVTDANHYKITHSAAATSGATGGGTVAYQYELTIGPQYGAYGLGYGVGGYGGGTYGTARDTSTIFSEPRVWAIDHFGQILLASYNVGTLYSWDPSAGSALSVRAAIVSDAPDDIRWMFVTPERFVIALCEQMRIDWCTLGDYTTWAITALNTAGSRKVTEGTKLVGGKPLGGGVSLIWSDSAVYVHQYTGTSLVFDTRLAGRNCGLISPSAVVTAGAAAYWMSHDTFFAYSSGGVQQIPNVADIRSFIFDNIRRDAGYLCAALYVSKFNEVWFFTVQQGSQEPGTYAIVNLNDFSWAVGSLERVAGTFFQHGDTRPYWAASDGHIYLHEDGRDADAVAIDAYCTLAPSALQSGKTQMDIDGFEPDFFEQSGDVTVTLSAWDRIRSASDTATESEAITCTETDTMLEPRLEGRYIGLTVRSNTLGGYFRFGVPTALVKPTGVRP